MKGDYHGVFATNTTFEEDIEWLESLRAEQPAYAKQLLLQGQELVAAAEAGRLRDIMLIAGKARSRELLPYFTINMFRQAACHGKTTVMRYMVVQGFDYTQQACRGLLLEVAGHQGVEAAERCGAAALLVKLGMRINRPVGTAGFTPLHVASAWGDAGMIAGLLRCGADPNAVGNWDVMPLHLAAAACEAGADELPVMLHTATSAAALPVAAGQLQDPGAEADSAVAALLKAGAKASWRASAEPRVKSSAPAAKLTLVQGSASTALPHAVTGAGGEASAEPAAPQRAVQMTRVVASSTGAKAAPSDGMRALAAAYSASRRRKTPRLDDGDVLLESVPSASCHTAAAAAAAVGGGSVQRSEDGGLTFSTQ